MTTEPSTGPSAVFRISATLSALASVPLSAIFGIAIVCLYIFVAVLAPLIAPYGENELFPVASADWSREFLVGTDQIGRDIFSRLIFGARNTLGIAAAVTALSFLVGGTLGMLSALNGGWMDLVLARIVDAMMALPSLISSLVLLSIFGSSIPQLILIIAAIDATRVFRVTRAASMNVVVMDFVDAARLRGETLHWILRREILPNIRLTLLAEVGVRFCFVFLTISALSFLGLGIQPPLADWGSMVRENAGLITYGEITPLLPAAAIAMLAISVNFIVDWILTVSNARRDLT